MKNYDYKKLAPGIRITIPEQIELNKRLEFLQFINITDSVHRGDLYDTKRNN
jgi:hypothetical protein